MKRLIKILSMVLTVAMLLSMSAFAAGESTLASIEKPDGNFDIPENLYMDWSGSTADQQVKHHSYAEYEALMKELVATYPDLCSLYSIGHSALERQLWCLEITNSQSKLSAAEKTGIGIFGNIHGGEMESAESAMYTGWWILLNSDSEYVEYMLDNYIIYCVPMINPDGMEQSFIYNVRYNLSARDADGDGLVFSDPYTDVDGDGFISNVFIGESGLDISQMTASRNSLSCGDVVLESLGMESPDWNLDGKMGNDPRSSGVDMNRTFDYMFGAYDITTYNTKGISYTGYEPGSIIGNNAWSTNGQENGPAYEAEIAAVQDFLADTPMNALVTLHTGIQCVLWPWCYRETDYETETELAQMAAVGTDMAAAFAEAASADGVIRNCYYRSSWSDYPTSAELIDWAYGRLGIHAYTIEVYSSGDSDPALTEADEWAGAYLNYDGTVTAGTTWQNGAQLETMASSYITEYTYDQVIGTGEGCLGFTEAQAQALGLEAGESLYFNTTQTAQMSGICPTNMDLMVEAAKDSILVMIEAEPYGAGYQLPAYLED